MSIWTVLNANVMQPPKIPVLSVGNLKGGVGKTTVVANLSVALTMAGYRVLAIDLDFQSSLSVALPPHIVPRCEDADGGIHILLSESYDMFHNSQVTAMGIGPFADLSLVRTSLELADVEDKLFAAFVLGEREKDARFSLARKLADPRLSRDFDIVIIDTPPRLTMASVNAFCASTHVLIPTALTPMSGSGAVTFAEFLNKFREKLCPHLRILGVIPTFTRGALNAMELNALNNMKADMPGVEIWSDHFIPHRRAIADNVGYGTPPMRQIFDPLAEKLIETLGLSPNGNPYGRGPYRSSQSGWARVPQ